MTNIFTRWHPAVTQTPIIRKGALGLAGLAFAGGAIAGPAAVTTQAAPPALPATTSVAQVTQDKPAPTSAKDLGFEYEEQPNAYYCGPAATRMALTALGQTPSQDEVAKQLGTTEAGTNSAEDITRVLNGMGGKDVYRTTAIPGKSVSGSEADKLKADVVKAIDDNRAVVANIIGSTTDTDGGEHTFPGGHYLTVVGYRDGGQAVKIADPWQPVGDGTYWLSVSDLADWAGSRGYSA